MLPQIHRLDLRSREETGNYETAKNSNAKTMLTHLPSQRLSYR